MRYFPCAPFRTGVNAGDPVESSVRSYAVPAGQHFLWLIIRRPFNELPAAVEKLKVIDDHRVGRIE
jgi:hypothetical protein